MSLTPPKFRKTEFTHRIGLASEKPAAIDVLVGTLYHSTDLGTTERSNGAAWATYFDPGLSASVFFYRLVADVTTISDPGAGKFKYNDQNQTSATTMVFDWLTDDGFDAHVLFQLFGPTTRFLMQDKALAVNYQLWEITSPATNMPDFFTVPVSFVSSGGSGVFSNNQRIAVIILPNAATLVV